VAVSAGANGLISEAIGRIGRKLAEVRARGLECFGSKSHGFVLNPPAAEAAVVAFEAEHGVRLPDGYREFVTMLGNGGAGPYYGLLPLERCTRDSGPLSRPSPLRPAGPDDNAAYLAGREDDLVDGAITLVDQGCAYSSLLIVTGPNRGSVVNIDHDLSGAPYFTRDAGFLAWYERWLDELLWGWDGSWFGFGLPGRETELASALLGSSGDERRDALRTLLRVPVLSQATLTAVAACAGDPDPPTRAAAITVLGKQGTGSAVIAGRVTDSDPAVRTAAVRALPEDAAVHWRAALTDPDPAVVRAALHRLAGCGQLTEADLAPVLAAGSPEIRATAVYYLEKTSARTVPAAMFTDPADRVVRQAILTAGSLRDQRSVPALQRLGSGAADPELKALIIRILNRIAAG
jgi:hypothetical protein